MKLAVSVIVLYSFIVCCTSAPDLIRTFDKDFRVFYENENTEKFNGKIWVVLVAGSKFYYNYRHQADICHAYQIVHSHGIPDEQIIVMMADDIANDKENPTPGILINHPDGKDVYHDVPKDYVGKDVTPQNFLNVLTGQKGTGGKVLQSGPNDNVFVFFADHGAPGLIAFPSGELYKDQLADAIQTMHQNNMYNQMVFYIEACESGSMFLDSLPNNINIYATTAANEKESSYACYFDETRKTYLGDRYSVSWMEDTDAANVNKESLHTQYQHVKKHTNQSHVQQFGNLTISSADTLSLFEGMKNAAPKEPMREIHDDVPSPDVKLHILKNRILGTNDIEEKKFLLNELEAEHTVRSKVSNVVTAIAYHVTAGINDLAKKVLNDSPVLRDMSCYRTAIKQFDNLCIDLQEVEYAYRHVFVFGNLCGEGFAADRIVNAMREICK